jgi:DNA-binding CsgD family transcriptional regulator
MQKRKELGKNGKSLEKRGAGMEITRNSISFYKMEIL